MKRLFEIKQTVIRSLTLLGVVPEPATLALLSLGGLGALCRKQA